MIYIACTNLTKVCCQLTLQNQYYSDLNIVIFICNASAPNKVLLTSQLEAIFRSFQREHVSELSLTTCNSLLEEICKKACLCIREVCKQHQALSEQLLPKHAPHYGMSAVTPSVTSAPGGGTIKRKNVAGVPPVAALQDKPMPGSESARERRDKQITEFVKSHLTLYSFFSLPYVSSDIQQKLTWNCPNE